ncbi:MAG TPA: hypothetical protein VGV12_12615 [Gemmatimonadales bacterium]|nr:hypothetical protein [Gemmatimonadales bacterium]
MTIKTDHPQDVSTPELLFHLLGAAHSLSDQVDKALSPLGLSPAALHLLSTLVTASEPPEARALAPKVGGLASATELLLDRLEQDGLVRRTSGGGGRPVRVVITARGRAQHGAALERLSALRLALAQAFGGTDTAAAERALAALR